MKRDPSYRPGQWHQQRGWSDLGEQSVNKCHCRERMRRRLGGTSLSSEARSRKAPARQSGWAEEAIKLSTTDRKHPTRTRIGKIWRAQNRRRHRDKLQAPRVRGLTTPPSARSQEQILNALYGQGLQEARTSQRAGTWEAESRGMQPTQRPLQHRWTPEGRRQSKSTGPQTGQPPELTGARRSVHESWRAGTGDTQHSRRMDARKSPSRIDRSTGATGTMI